eukprot:COSAG01_NODE_26054_length_724_cov_150.344000_1_plen_118_part_10
MVARATAVTTHRPALAATTTWAVPKYPTDSTDCLPSHMAQTHKHDTMSTAHCTHTRSAPCRATAEKLLVDCVSAHPPPVVRHDTQTPPSPRSNHQVSCAKVLDVATKLHTDTTRRHPL